MGWRNTVTITTVKMPSVARVASIANETKRIHAGTLMKRRTTAIGTMYNTRISHLKAPSSLSKAAADSGSPNLEIEPGGWIGKGRRKSCSEKIGVAECLGWEETYCLDIPLAFSRR
jgi:hypothetical protein